MNTLTRNLIGFGTAATMFAGAFLVASAITEPAKAYSVDPAIDVPGSTVEQSEVLSPVAYGNLTNAQADAAGFSSIVGTAQVVIPEGSEDGVPENAPPPGIIAAAAALDSAAGDPSEIMPATPDGDAPRESAPAPSPDPGSNGHP